MPFNFQDTYVNPNVQIKGEEIPLEQLEKTSNVIQGRYDTSMDNETKIGAITKKLLASSNPVDHETAKQIMERNKNRLADRAKSGNYQDMVWQTQQDALDTAGMFEGLNNRNKQIQQGLEEISKSPKYLTDDSRNKAVIEYNKKLKSATFNQENGVLEGLNVDPFNEAADVAVEQEFLKVAPHIKTTTRNGQAAHLGYVSAKTGLPTNKPTQGDYLAKIDASGKSEILTSTDIRNEMLKYGKSHTGINAMVERDLNRMGIENPEERAKIGDKIFHNYVDNAASSMSTMFDVNNIGEKGNFQLLGAYNEPNPRSNSGYQPDVPNVGWTGLPTKLDTNKSIEDIKETKNELNAAAFDKNGNFIGVPETTTDKTFRALAWLGGEDNPSQKDMKITSIIPNYFYKTYKKEGVSDKDVFNKYMDLKENNSKIASLDYNISGKKMRETFDSNILANQSNVSFYTNDSDQKEITGDDREKALKDPNKTIKVNPYTGNILVSSGGKDYLTNLGKVGDGKNFTQLQKKMAGVSQILKSALNPDQAFDRTEFTIPSEVGGQIIDKTYTMLQTGYGKDKNGNPLPGKIVELIGPPNNRIVARSYNIEEDGISKFVKNVLNESVHENNLGME